MEKPIRVRILDHEYLLKSDENEELVQEIAQFVNDKLMEIGHGTDRLSEAKVAILAAFHIASDYFQVLKERDGLKRDIQERARSLNYQIDSIMR
ncbi:MAG: cell division protein ZapA [Desulfatiglandaceae bacterium]